MENIKHVESQREWYNYSLNLIERMKKLADMKKAGLNVSIRLPTCTPLLDYVEANARH